MGLFGNKGKKAATKQGGLTVSDRVLKNEHLGSDFILSGIEDAVVMVGRDNLIHLFNPAAAKITGWAPEEAVGLDFHSVLTLVDEHGAAYAEESHPIAKVFRTGTPVRDSNGQLETRSKKRLPVSLIVTPIVEEPGKPADIVVGVLRDTTNERAEEARRSDFISTASHEMRTPIAAIEGYLALVLNPKIAKVDDNARKYLEKAQSSTQHLGILFQDLLTSSRAEDGRLASYPVVVELGEVIQQTVDTGRFNAHTKRLQLHYVLSSAGGIAGGKVISPKFYTFVDPNRIREVIQNLIDNAIKYTMEGSITVRLTGNQSVVQVQVSDTGGGIASEDIPHLFQKFYRVDNSMTRTIGGTGLGLFICKKIVELYNGSIWVESTIGKGSTFFINLPRLTSEQALEMQKRQASTISPLDIH